MGATLKDVAERAGVSTMTVSRALTGTGYVSAETRARVQAAVAELGYVPNALARHLRSRKTRTLALVISDITNPFFTTLARGVEDVAAAHGFAVMFGNTDESEAKELEYVRTVIGRQIQGVLLVPAGDAREPLALLGAHNVPTVVLDRRVPASIDQVRSDSEDGAHRLVEELISLGHRRIALLTGRSTISTAADREAGYRRALDENGVPTDPRLVCSDQFSLDGGYDMARRVLALESPPTAMFAANSFIAFGALKALREAGLGVPEDVSLVCFDDLPSEWLIDPFFTVAVQDAAGIGRRGAELILERIESDQPHTPRSIVLPVELVRRRSAARPAGRHPESIPA
jgi:LacI family transcriptional regulator